MTREQCLAARYALGWPRSVLASKTGLTVAMIGFFERGARMLKDENMEKIRRAFLETGVDVAAL